MMGVYQARLAPPCLTLQTPIPLCAISPIIELLQFRLWLVMVLAKCCETVPQCNHKVGDLESIEICVGVSPFMQNASA